MLKWKFVTDIVFMKVFQKVVHHNCVMGLVVSYTCIRFYGQAYHFHLHNISQKGVLLPLSYSNGILGQPGADLEK